MDTPLLLRHALSDRLAFILRHTHFLHTDWELAPIIADAVLPALIRIFIAALMPSLAAAISTPLE